MLKLYSQRILLWYVKQLEQVFGHICVEFLTTKLFDGCMSCAPSWFQDVL